MVYTSFLRFWSDRERTTTYRRSTYSRKGVCMSLLLRCFLTLVSHFKIVFLYVFLYSFTILLMEFIIYVLNGLQIVPPLWCLFF